MTGFVDVPTPARSFAGPAGSTVTPARIEGGRVSVIRHLPSAEPSAGCVICPPAFHEYQLCQRSLRVLAERLCAAGLAVSRVDYRSVGDSPAAPEPATLEVWVDDASAAAADLRAVSGVRPVHFLGLRAGAAVALEATARSPGSIAFLWSLPATGDEHLAELDAVHRAWFSAYAAQHGGDADPSAADTGIAGHPAPAALRASLASWTPEVVEAGVERVRFESGPRPGEPGILELPGPAPWRESIDVAAPPVPAAALERIVATVVERTS